MIVSKNLDRNFTGVVGIDCGKFGAIAIWYCGGIGKVIDIPLHNVMVSGSVRKMVDYERFAEILTEYVNQGYRFTVEMTPVFVVGSGSSSSANWSLGYSQGFLTSFFLMKGASFQFVRTQEWHKFYDYRSIDFSSLESIVDRSKKDVERKKLIKKHSLMHAQKIAPAVVFVEDGRRFKTGRVTADKFYDGRCEAVLIANYGAKYNGRKSS